FSRPLGDLERFGPVSLRFDRTGQQPQQRSDPRSRFFESQIPESPANQSWISSPTGDRVTGYNSSRSFPRLQRTSPYAVIVGNDHPQRMLASDKPVVASCCSPWLTANR